MDERLGRIRVRDGLAVAVPVCLQVAFLVWLWAGFLTDWDSYLYSASALRFEPISLGLGRWFYCGFLGVVWRVFGSVFSVGVDSSWMVFALSSAALAVVNVPLLFVLARRWTDRRTGFVAACIVASSPLVAIYGGAVMTETLTITLMLLSLILLTGRGRSAGVVGSGLLFGLACSIREPTFFFFPMYFGLLWGLGADLRGRTGKMLLFGFAAVAIVFVGWLAAFLTNPDWLDVYRQWQAGMLREREAMVSSLPAMLVGNMCYYAIFLLMVSPFAVLTLPGQLRRLRGRSSGRFVALAAGVGLYSIVEIANHTLVFNPRFVIPAGFLMCILAAAAIVDLVGRVVKSPFWPGLGVIAVHAGLVLAGGPVIDKYLYEKSRAAGEVFVSLASAGDEAVFVPGKLTPVVEYYRQLHRPRWRIVHAGWSFEPGQIDEATEFVREMSPSTEFFLVEKKYWPSRRHRPQQWQALADVHSRYRGRQSVVTHFSLLDLTAEDAKDAEKDERR